jgi:hypothetical protein
MNESLADNYRRNIYLLSDFFVTGAAARKLAGLLGARNSKN